MSIIEKLDEFTSRQGIVSAEWCKLLDEVEDLQEQHKIMREALEYYASVKNWKYATDSCLDRLEFNDNDGEFIMGEGHVYGKRAREALAKVE